VDVFTTEIVATYEASVSSQQTDGPPTKVRRKMHADLPMETKVDCVVKAYQLVSKGLSKGAADKEVAKAVGASAFAVRNWRQAYDKKGIPGLGNRRRGNKNASKRTAVSD